MYMSNEPLTWTAKVRKVEELKNYERNPRKIDEVSYTRLLNRIRTRGFHDVIKLDDNDFILSGNQRKRALTELGIEKVNTLSPSRPLTEEEKKAVLVESNRSDGFFDFDMLAADYSPEELQELGFSERELDMVEFPELDEFSSTEEVDTTEMKKYELIFASVEDYKAFSSLVKKVQSDYYPESSVSTAVHKFIADKISM